MDVLLPEPSRLDAWTPAPFNAVAALVSDRHYRLLADSLPQTVCVTSATGDVEYCNAAWRAYTGLTDEETRRAGWAASLHPDDVPGVAEQFSASQRAGQAFDTEFRLRRHDGQFRWHAARGVPLQDEAGTLYGWLGTAIDIDAQRRRDEASAFLAEASRRVAESLEYETTLNAVARLAVPRLADWCTVHLTEEEPLTAPRCVAIAHRDPHAVEWAWSLQGRFPYHPLAPHGLPRVLRTGKAELLPEITEEVLSAALPDPEQLELTRMVGLTSAMFVPMLARGRTVGVLSFYYADSGRRYDTDDLRLAENLASSAALAVDTARLYQESRDAERRIAVVAEAGAVLATSLDPADTTRSLARVAVSSLADVCLVFLQDESGALTGTAAAHRNYKLQALTEAFAQAHYQPGGRRVSNLSRVAQSGEPVLIKELSTAILDAAVTDARARELIARLDPHSAIVIPLVAHRTTLGVLALLRSDMLVPFDAEDLMLGEALAHRAALALDNARLYADAKEADQRKDQFLAMLAHELRNPLSAIRNAMAVMEARGQGTPDSERVQGRQREIIHRQTDHLSRMVEDLLDVSRITRGIVPLQTQAVSAAQVVLQALESCRHHLEERGQFFELTLPSEPLLIQVDPTRMAQVICNLLGNASKYSPTGGRVQLKLEAHGSEACIRVADNGRGIPPELLPRVFDLFVQADHSLARSEGGLGIGLTIVRHLVEQQGGRVEARSMGTDQGSEFAVWMPLADGAASTAECPGLAMGQGSRSLPVQEQNGMQNGFHPVDSSSSSAPLRVLVVDDNRDAAESLGDLLELWGFEGRVAFDGPSALKTAADYRPEVVLLDIGLPGMDGYAVARELRAEGPTGEPLLPGSGQGASYGLLVAVTGYGQEEDRRRAFEAGFDHHLTKPVDPSRLKALLVDAPRAEG